MFFKQLPDGSLPSKPDGTPFLDHAKILKFVATKYYPYFRYAGLQHEDAEESISNVAFKFIGALEKRKIEKHPLAYLNVIARRELFDQIQNLKLQRSHKELAHFIAKEDGNKVILGLPELEAELLLIDILAVLTTRQQEIVKLLIAGYTPAEISREIDIKPSTVSYHIKRVKELMVVKYGLQSSPDLRGKRKKKKLTKPGQSEESV